MKYKKAYKNLKKLYDELQDKDTRQENIIELLKQDIKELTTRDVKKPDSELCRVCVHQKVYRTKGFGGNIFIGCEKDLKCESFVPAKHVEKQ